MRRLFLVLVLALTLGIAAVPAASTAGTPHRAHARDEVPVRSIAVDGTGVASYPDFDPAITRYGITTTADTGGTVTVTASTTDPSGTVRINGVLAPEGTQMLEGLTEGDEISVIITDSAGTTAYALIYLPAKFPTLVRDTSLPNENPSAGAVLLTLGLWVKPSPFFQTAVDANGVPLMVHTETSTIDFKPGPDGGYTVFRPATNPSPGGFLGVDYDFVQLDSSFNEVKRWHTIGLSGGTDGHDAIVMPDGSVYLLSYQPNESTGFTDTVVQQIAADGTLEWEWNSGDYVDPATETVLPNGNNAEYAHVNSIQVLDNGDLLLSFRHLSSVWRIARTAHDGYASGDIVWKLGGRDSSFTMTDENGDPDNGPCAQHTAYMQADGNIVMFDDGSAAIGGAPLCVNQSDPTGSAVYRANTRISEWSVDPVNGTAHIVWNYSDPDRTAIFAGSSERLANGNTLIGWAAARQAIASEVNPAGDVVWDLKDANPTLTDRYFTYRAFKAEVPDTQDPVVDLTGIDDGATYTEGSLPTPEISCTDRGGSTLQTCDAPAPDGTPGDHVYAATATDGAGNTTTVERSYEVLPLQQPDAQLRLGGSGPWTGEGTWGVSGQTVAVNLKKKRTGTTTATVQVRIANAGQAADQLQVVRPRGASGISVKTDLPPGNLSPVLQPGKRWPFTVTITRLRAATPGTRIQVPITVTSVGNPARTDVVVLRITALR